MNRSAEEYAALPYTRVIREISDESGHYFHGRILEFDGCQSTGSTLEKLYENLDEAMKGWIEVRLENGLPVPDPETADRYSGKFVVRLPRSLHRKLAMDAENEGISLNRLVLRRLSS